MCECLGKKVGKWGHKIKKRQLKKGGGGGEKTKEKEGGE